MEIPFQTSARKWLLAAVAVLLAILYLGLAGRRFLAAWFGDQPEQASLERAARLDPGNADYRNHLGRYFELVARDPAAAVAPYQAAVQLNPHAARYWFDLARVFQILGNTPAQSHALEQAIQADPSTPDVAWEAANLYLVQGENQKALREFRVVLENDSTLAGAAIQHCWRIEPDVDALLRDVVPAQADPYSAFLSLLMIKGETAGTAKVWSALYDSHQYFDMRFALEYFRYLMLQKDVDQAALVWRQTAERFRLTSYLPSASNLIVNGNFSLEVLNGGFDWQYQKQRGVDLTLDPGTFHGGRRSLLISFDGPGIADAGILQLIPVNPDTAYEFSAYFKTGEMEGAGGPHITIQDAYTKDLYYDSDELKDVSFWKSVRGEFTTASDCKLLLLHVRRLPEGSPIRGKLWIDDLRLTRKPS
jgi:tetratricopeptide (TPR) repeat protein